MTDYQNECRRLLRSAGVPDWDDSAIKMEETLREIVSRELKPYLAVVESVRREEKIYPGMTPHSEVLAALDKAQKEVGE